MTVTAKDLRFNISMLFDALGKSEDIIITYRGKARAKLIGINEKKSHEKDDIAFGIWSDRDENVDKMVRKIRKGRRFDI
ncbi:MAG: type II toxin-antitoxin system Phd/YefM family antitoxin [Campylobacteraceae bacterium]|nr:type II toxin-antitoxin system Phd/YefM family antitoxin [Campylobacteraceae bacterium]